jgi:hypothetical protein
MTGNLFQEMGFMMRIRAWTVLMLAALIAAGSLPGAAQSADQTASQFYMAYRAAFAKAKKVDEILPFLSKATRKEIEDTPAAERPKMFEMIKMMDTFTQVKVVKESKTANGATLSVEAVDSEKKKSTATVEILEEDGAWKLGSESWSSSS